METNNNNTPTTYLRKESSSTYLRKESSSTYLRKCPGHRHVNDSRTWYVPKGCTKNETTICEECFDTYLKNTCDPKSYKKFVIGFMQQLNCNCDYEAYSKKLHPDNNFLTFDYLINNNSVTCDGIQMSVCLVETEKPCPKIENQRRIKLNIIVNNLLITTFNLTFGI